MSERKGNDIIYLLQRKWNFRILLIYFLTALAITIFVSAFALAIWHTSWLFSLPVLLLSFAFLYFLFFKKIDVEDVAKFLNKTFPDLQESTQLMLQPLDTLNGLQKLQLKRIETKLSEQTPLPPLIRKRMISSFVMLIAALLIASILSVMPFLRVYSSFQNKVLRNTSLVIKPEIKLPEIKDVNITITPPIYTRKPAREQDKFAIIAEQKASVTWHIITTTKANNVELIFNDKSTLSLKRTDQKSTQWSVSKQVFQSGFYQIRIDSKLSELYQIDMIRDEPPVINVQSPKPGLFIKWGESQKVNIVVALSDDYGIDSTFIHATTASGGGEAVTFKERQFSFSNFHRGDKNDVLNKTIDLPSLGMTPGDELYFYITATDNNKQQKRSDVFIVRLEDTAQLFSMSGLVNGLDIKPELFRSERQIIIETEQLLKDKDNISEDEFKKRSTNLGTDQELLRLRYGKYLGEETETEVGGDHHNESNDAADFGNADKVIDEFSHKHDIAEDADFFDAPTKKQLQAMLTEMWKASLQLKTYKPKDALPFAYNALRLLKDLQQKTRAFVAKTGMQTTPLNPGKRLTGELDKITQPVMKETSQQDESSLTLRKAIGVLEKIRSEEVLQKKDFDVLDEAGKQLSVMAASHPSIYLQAYEALGRLKDNKAKPGDISLTGTAFQKMITTVANVPQQGKSAPDMTLSRHYFLHLNKTND